nr:hypothetical protein [uncultured Roseobacter sp.]
MLEIIEDFLYEKASLDDNARQPATGWNIKPTQSVSMIRQKDEGYLLTTARRWFVPHWFKHDVKD